MFPPTDNPAERLVGLLKTARDKDNRATKDVWSSVFGISKIDNAAFYRIMSYLLGLVDAIEVRIKQEKGINHELFLRDLPVIRGIICPDNINVNWHSIKTPLNTGVLTGLEFCAEKLSHSHSEDVIPETELAETRQEFSKLVEQVTNSELSPNLKVVLLDLLTSAILAIENYKITGNDGIKRSIAYIIGLLSLHKDLFKEAKGDGIMQKTSELLSRMVQAVSTAYKVKELGDAIRKLIAAV